MTSELMEANARRDSREFSTVAGYSKTMILSDPSPNGTIEPGRAVIETHNLTRYFGSTCAVDTVSLSVPRGSVFAFIGRNDVIAATRRVGMLVT